MVFSFFKKKTGEERREEIRFERIFITQCDTDKHKCFSTAFNLSKTGVGIFIDHPIEKNSKITVTLQYEFKNGAYDSTKAINLTFQATVAWLQKEVNSENKISHYASEFSDDNIDLYMAGLKFDDLTEESTRQLEDILSEQNKSS